MDAKLIAKAEAKLRLLDPLLGALIDRQVLEPRPLRTDYFASLARSIIGQQVSVAAAAAISKRFEEHTGLNPKNVVALNETTIKTIGLSKQKAGYLKDLAEHFVRDPAVYDHLEAQSDEQVINELVAVKGIGVWTAQMFLMFTLARPDVFAPDDVGLQRGIMRLYNFDALPPKSELVRLSEKWQPYRSIASLHLWQSLNNTPA